MENIELVIFDMDGLIFDSERIFMEQLGSVMAEYGYVLTENIYLKTIGLNGIILKETMLKQYGENYPFEEISRKARKRVNEIAEDGKLTVKKGIPELLEHIKQKNIKSCVASSSPTRFVEQYLKLYGLYNYFSGVTGGEKVAKSKPEPDIFLKACADFDVKPDKAIVLEDSQNGIIAAYRAKIRSVCIPDLKVPDKEVLKTAFLVADNALDVIKII
jgi:HAD superfamily hydrolase (TIGR01509 family)